jgi:hypothetical protein
VSGPCSGTATPAAAPACAAASLCAAGAGGAQTGATIEAAAAAAREPVAPATPAASAGAGACRSDAGAPPRRSPRTPLRASSLLRRCTVLSATAGSRLQWAASRLRRDASACSLADSVATSDLSPAASPFTSSCFGSSSSSRSSSNGCSAASSGASSADSSNSDLYAGAGAPAAAAPAAALLCPMRPSVRRQLGLLGPGPLPNDDAMDMAVDEPARGLSGCGAFEAGADLSLSASLEEAAAQKLLQPSADVRSLDVP